MDTVTTEEIEAAYSVIFSKGEYLSHILRPEQTAACIKLAEAPKMQLSSRFAKQLIIQMVYVIYTAYWYSIPVASLTTQIYFLREDVQNKVLKPYLCCQVSEQEGNQPMLHAVQIIFKKLSSFEGWLDDEMKNFVSYVEATKYLRLRQDTHRSLKYLQLSYVFRRYSTLVRIQNCCLLSTILSEQDYFNKVYTKVSQQEQLLYKYHALERRGGESDDMELYLINQQKLIKQLMEYDFIEQVTVENAYDTNIQDTYYLAFIMNINERKYILSDAIMELLEQQERTQYNTQKLCQEYDMPTNQYFFMYSSQRNSISLQLFTDYANTPDMSDFISVQCQNFNMCSHLVSLELANKASSSDKSKWLTLKVNNCHTMKEPLVEKILYMCDVLLVSRMVFEDSFQDISKKSGRQEHYSRILAAMFQQLITLRQNRNNSNKKEEE